MSNAVKSSTTLIIFRLTIICVNMSAFYIDLLGPLHWISKWQAVTAASSAEAEIYATDECVNFLHELVQILDFLDVRHIVMTKAIII